MKLLIIIDKEAKFQNIRKNKKQTQNNFLLKSVKSENIKKKIIKKQNYLKKKIPDNTVFSCLSTSASSKRLILRLSRSTDWAVIIS